MTIQRKDRFTEKDKIRKTYSDFTSDLTPHPNTEDLVVLTNESSVKRSIRNLFLTNKGERLFNPNLGSNIKKLLFEPIDEHTTKTLKTYCEEIIKNYEPRAKAVQIEVIPNEINQSYIISVVFYIINNQTPSNMTVTLYRIR